MREAIKCFERSVKIVPNTFLLSNAPFHLSSIATKEYCEFLLSCIDILKDFDLQTLWNVWMITFQKSLTLQAVYLLDDSFL